jgi:protein-disulfide isomerase
MGHSLTPSGRALTAALVAAVLAALPEDSGAQTPDVSEVGHTLGDPTAPVRIVEFGDFACSACGEFWQSTWSRVREDLIETGRVAWRHVPFVLGFPNGDDAANAAECAADQAAFWDMHDRLFAGQAEWIGERRPEEVFRGYAAEIGLDAPAFRACFEDEGGKDRTEAANRAARAAAVRATPTFFINDKIVLGALPYEAFLHLVEAAERTEP